MTNVPRSERWSAYRGSSVSDGLNVLLAQAMHFWMVLE